MDNMEQVISIDNGRYGVKIVTDKLKKRLKNLKNIPDQMKDKYLIRAVVAPGRDFRMDIDLTNPNYFLIEKYHQNYMVGDLAIKQSSEGKENRTEGKNTAIDQIIMSCASSFVADSGDDLILLTNCPARNWTPENRREIAKSFEGFYSITHHAGMRSGETIHYRIIKVYVLPEGTGAFYDYVYDDALNVVHPEFLQGTTLVLDIGDQTVNRLVFIDGEYKDELCGSIDSGLHTVHSVIQSQFEDMGTDYSLAEISDAIVNHKPLYVGKEVKNVNLMAQKLYEDIAAKIFSNVVGKIQVKRIRNVLLAGGGALNLRMLLMNHFSMSNIGFIQNDSQWMNANGFKKMYWEMLKEKRNQAVLNG